MEITLDDSHWNEFEEGYYKYRPLQDRKTLGQYFTPYVVAKFMTEIALEKRPERILDPAMGHGIFPSIIQAQNKENLCTIDAFEIDPVVIDYSRHILPRNLKVNNCDFLDSKIDVKYDCIIGNPPYTIYKTQPVSEDLLKFYSLVIGSRLAPTTNIYNIFVLKCLELLKENGRAVLIVPSEFMGTDYGVAIKKHFIKSRTLSRVIFFDHEDVVFKTGISSACILVFDKGENPTVKLQTATILDKHNPAIKIKVEHELRIDSLDPHSKWYNLIGAIGNIKRPIHKLGEFARSKRGLATGDNAYFLFNKEKAEKHCIPKKYLRPCIAKAGQVSGHLLDMSGFNRLVEENENTFVLDIAESDLNDCESLREYIDLGLTEGVSKKYLPSHRNPWYSTENMNIPQLFVSTFSRGQVKFIVNEAGVSHLTCFHGITFLKPDMNQIAIKAMAAYLNSDYCHNLISTEKRRLGGGLSKLEPRDVEKIPVPNFDLIPGDNLEFLSEAFDAFSKGKISSTELSVKVINKLNLD